MKFYDDFINLNAPGWIWLLFWIIVIGIIVLCSIEWIIMSKTIINKCNDGKTCTYKW